MRQAAHSRYPTGAVLRRYLGIDCPRSAGAMRRRQPRRGRRLQPLRVGDPLAEIRQREPRRRTHGVGVNKEILPSAHPELIEAALEIGGPIQSQAIGRLLGGDEVERALPALLDPRDALAQPGEPFRRQLRVAVVPTFLGWGLLASGRRRNRGPPGGFLGWRVRAPRWTISRFSRRQTRGPTLEFRRGLGYRSARTSSHEEGFEDPNADPPGRRETRRARQRGRVIGTERRDTRIGLPCLLPGLA